MIIEGKKIKFNAKNRDTSEYYINIIRREVRYALRQLSFVKDVKYQKSKTTNSIYYQVSLKNHSRDFFVSIRTHKPSKELENYFYFYTPLIEDLADLRFQIRWSLTIFYDAEAEKNHYRKAEIPKKPNLK